MKTLFTITALVLLLSSCKKDDNFPDYLLGTWSDVQYKINNGGAAYKCDVKFSKLSDDKLKMEVLSGYYNGDDYVINVDGNGSGLHVYTQSVNNSGTIYIVSGTGTAHGSGAFNIDITRSKGSQSDKISYSGY